MAAQGTDAGVADNARQAIAQLRGALGLSQQQQETAAVQLGQETRDPFLTCSSPTEVPLSEATAAAWLEGMALFQNFSFRFDRERVMDPEGLALLRGAALRIAGMLDPQSVSLVAVDQGQQQQQQQQQQDQRQQQAATPQDPAPTTALAALSDRRRDLALEQLQHIYAALVRSGRSEDLRMAAHWSLERAQLAACQQNFAVSESEGSCWNTALSGAITYLRRAGDAATAERVREFANEHPEAATHYARQDQTPHVFFPGLAARPWWPPEDFATVALLKERHRDLLADLARLKATLREADAPAGPTFARVFSPAAPIQPGALETDRAGSGDWAEFTLFDGYHWHPTHCQVTPHMCAALQRSPELCGGGGSDPTPCGTRVVATVFRLAPGARVLPHTGVTNRRLVLQYALEGSEGVSFRVGGTARSYGGDGEAIVFDDSFEHEVVHNGTAHRFVLYAVLLHPQVPRGELDPEEPVAEAWDRRDRDHPTPGDQTQVAENAREEAVRKAIPWWRRWGRRRSRGGTGPADARQAADQGRSGEATSAAPVHTTSSGGTGGRGRARRVELGRAH